MLRCVPGIAVAASCVALALPAAAEDLTIVSKTRFGKNEGHQTVFLTPARMLTKGGGGDAIVEFGDGTMTFLDEEKKTYYVTSIAEMDAYARRRGEQAKASDFNAQAFGALGEAAAKKTGKARTIAGYSCESWVVALGDALVFDVCAAPELPVPPAYFDARQAAYSGIGPMGRHFQKVFEAMRQVRGYPLFLAMHVRTAGMKQETLTEATEVHKGSIPPETFAVPPDYARKKSPFAP
jgi:hypothetical protein